MKLSTFANNLVATIAVLSAPAVAQTWSNCNPIYSTCPENSALGRNVEIDFRNGPADVFEAYYGATYKEDGAHMTVVQSGDSPQLISRFYIMFGHVSVRMKAAPGAGIVSSLVLQSDTLDEIDYEWLGAVTNEVQSNYFGKGDTTSYTRGAFHQTPENTNNFITYEIEWTADQVVWSIDGTPVRVLTPGTAEPNQYPQTPMQVKFGAWSGGDSGNPQGTIEWAKGPTDYSTGPFNMIVESISVTDYSTGTAYRYNGNTGNLDTIVAVDGVIGGNQGSKSVVEVPSPVLDAASSTSSGPIIPPGIGYTADPTEETPSEDSNGGYQAPPPQVPGVPEGWVVTAEGKIVPINSGFATRLNRNCLLLSLAALVVASL